mgnify:CR=1 FL=1
MNCSSLALRVTPLTGQHVAVRADPSSSLHLEAGIAWLGMRIVHLIALTALAFPESHRAKRCVLVEMFFAFARCAVSQIGQYFFARKRSLHGLHIR